MKNMNRGTIENWSLTSGGSGGMKRVGFVNFPNQGNPDDSGIWLGYKSLLREKKRAMS